jgi:hypothetical protein
MLEEPLFCKNILYPKFIGVRSSCGERCRERSREERRRVETQL